MLFLTLFLIILFLIVFHSKHLLIVLLLLEFLTFSVLLVFVSFYSSSVIIEDAMIVSLFAVFVIEGVIALSLLIILVSFRGTDYLRVKNFLKF